MNEFEMIERYFKPLTQGHGEAADLVNDAAVLKVPEGFELVATSDISTAGVHFLPDQPPGTIAKKALRRNISDLHAMGAKPYCYQMCLALPQALPAPEWLEAFTAALAGDQETFGLFLSGGDTSSTPGPLSISITAMGLAEAGKAWSRAGARDGDLAVLSGPVGDAYCGLKALREGIEAPALMEKYYVPDLPPLPPSQQDVHAAIDISDGLAQDLGHICKASGLAAEIETERFRFSPAVQDWLERGLVSVGEVLTGGDDYRLLLALPPGSRAEAEGRGWQVIGRFKAGAPGVTILQNGQVLEIRQAGWRHF